MKKLTSIIKEMYTDSKNRPEAKMILGIPIIIISVIYGILTKDWDGFKCLFGGGCILIGVTAVTDTILDTNRKTNEDIYINKNY